MAYFEQGSTPQSRVNSAQQLDGAESQESRMETPEGRPPISGGKVGRRNLFRVVGLVAVAGFIGERLSTSGIAGSGSIASAGTRTMPDSSNTGVIPGSSLTVYHGDIVITTDGAVLQNLDIDGNVTVKANNVTIRNCLIRGSAVAPTSGSYALIMQFSNSYKNLLVEDCTLVAQLPNQWTSGIQATNFTVLRCDISSTVDGIDAMGAGNVLVDSCYIHNGSYFTPSRTHNDNQTHDDGIQATNGTNIVFSNNNIRSFAMSCFMIGQAQGPIVGLKITNNWLDGGTATINLSGNSYGTLRPVITGNRLGRSRRNTYAILATGPVDLSDVTGNVWDDNGQPVPITIK